MGTDSDKCPAKPGDFVHISPLRYRWFQEWEIKHHFGRGYFKRRAASAFIAGLDSSKNERDIERKRR